MSFRLGPANTRPASGGPRSACPRTSPWSRRTTRRESRNRSRRC